MEGIEERLQVKALTVAPIDGLDAGLEPSNALGFALSALACSATAAGIALSTHDALLVWLLGQCILAVALLQWFVLLHEAGHGTLFRSRYLNRAAGHVGGFFALIPFASWRRIHGLHHLWTGWQDLDPTTAALAPRSRSRIECTVVDLAWRTGLPFFSIVYRLSNYWNAVRFGAIFRAPRQRAALALNIAVLVAIYGLLLWSLGVHESLRIAALAVLLSLALQDPLILSQHTHIPQHVSHGATVRPFPAIEQEEFSRSLRLPRWLSSLLLHFDAHELHHMYPFVPGYRLNGVPYTPQNEVGYWDWIRAAKRVPGEVFLFQNRTESGWEI